MIDDTNWTVVVNKRRTRHPPPPNHGVMTLAPSPSHRPLKTIEYSSCSEDLIMSRLKRSMERVEKSEFFGRFLEQLQTSSNGLARRLSFQGIEEGHKDEESKVQIVVYGIGSIADSEISRCQFALIMLLKQMFSWIGCIEVYDPVLSPSECRVMEGMGCLMIGVNEEGLKSIQTHTIFYMPHCEDWLYNNVLQANWIPEKLNQLVILGNSFRSYHDAWSSFQVSQLKAPPTYVLEFHQRAKEIPLEATSSLQLPAFNNTSWHFLSET